MTPGFWSGVTGLQTPAAPILKIRLTNNGKVVLSWPASVVGFDLEETTSLTTNQWSLTSQSIVDAGSEHTVTVPATGGFKSYRLKSQGAF